MSGFRNFDLVRAMSFSSGLAPSAVLDFHPPDFPKWPAPLRSCVLLADAADAFTLPAWRGSAARRRLAAASSRSTAGFCPAPRSGVTIDSADRNNASWRRIAVELVDLVDAPLDLGVMVTFTESRSVFSCAMLVAPMMFEVTKGSRRHIGDGELRGIGADVAGKRQIGVRWPLRPRLFIALGALEQRRSRAGGRAPPYICR